MGSGEEGVDGGADGGAEGRAVGGIFDNRAGYGGRSVNGFLKESNPRKNSRG